MTTHISVNVSNIEHVLQLLFLYFVLQTHSVERFELYYLRFLIPRIKYVDAPALGQLVLHILHGQVLELLIYLNGLFSRKPGWHLLEHKVFYSQHEGQIYARQMSLLCSFYLVHGDSKLK